MDAYVWARPYQQIVFKSPVTVEFFEWKDSCVLGFHLRAVDN